MIDLDKTIGITITNKKTGEEWTYMIKARYVLMVFAFVFVAWTMLITAGCGGNIEIVDAEPNGYCEVDDECAPEDRCEVERERDAHLSGGMREINRCTPRPDVGDWCEFGWCGSDAYCDLAPGAERGVCRDLCDCDETEVCVDGRQCMDQKRACTAGKIDC